MDDLIVIILTLIVAVVGIIGQSKKKKRAPNTPGSTNSPGNIWELLQREMEPQQNIAEPELVEEIEIEEINEWPVQQVQNQFKTQNEGISEIKDEVAVENPIKVKIKKENFSLKKAVIYSEILNSKYI